MVKGGKYFQLVMISMLDTSYYSSELKEEIVVINCFTVVMNTLDDIVKSFVKLNLVYISATITEFESSSSKRTGWLL